jgi:hypothetical protein
MVHFLYDSPLNNETPSRSISETENNSLFNSLFIPSVWIVNSTKQFALRSMRNLLNGKGSLL